MSINNVVSIPEGVFWNLKVMMFAFGAVKPVEKMFVQLAGGDVLEITFHDTPPSADQEMVRNMLGSVVLALNHNPTAYPFPGVSCSEVCTKTGDVLMACIPI